MRSVVRRYRAIKKEKTHERTECQSKVLRIRGEACRHPGHRSVRGRTLLPVFSTYGDGKANESWSKHTPSGKIEMNITNPDAIDAFDVGKAYFVDFTPVEGA